ncbi:unnamed protein product [Cladocopium goreaui]|uniref:Endoplasmic reticulum-based factor for assembly of V-ATPase n=1 Tax=Cladocopium goreaui TaxID=2562237 RepID=A0A9P1C1S6_9DINO|nr:unnamed protein product [Cladocopium goreaui]
MPSQVFVSIPDALRQFLSSECRAEGAKEVAQQSACELDELYRLADEHLKLTQEPVKMHELLATAEVVERREVPALGEDGEPLSELEQMRAASQERAYQRMVDGVAPLTGQRRTEPLPHQQGLRFATNFGTQVIVAFIGAFLLGYYFVETFVAPESFNAKVIAGASCSFATLLLETFLLVIHEQKQTIMEKKREKHAQKTARKVVAVQHPKNEEPKSGQEKKDD